MNNKLQYFQLVNQCETLEQLSNVITEIGLENKGLIKGKRQLFDAEKMASNCLSLPDTSLTFLTTVYGIRQQAVYILHKTGELNIVKESTDITEVTLGDIIEFIKQMR